MATKFAKEQTVRVKAVTPQGPVQKFKMDEETGDMSYLVDWTDASGETQSRWFKEDELEAV